MQGTTRIIAQEADRLAHALVIIRAWGDTFPIGSWGYHAAARHESELRAAAITSVRHQQRRDRTEQRGGVY
jgi:hypothetical protein